MFRLIRHAVRWTIVLTTLWFVAVSGLPSLRRAIPALCERGSLQGGFCGEAVRSALGTIDDWSQQHLRPLPRDTRVLAAAREVQKRLRLAEDVARTQIGDKPVDDALRGAEQALRTLEQTVNRAGDVRRKITDVPQNLDGLLARVRDAFDQLRHILQTTGRSADQVSGAFAETTKALDALANFLPARPSPSPAS